MDWQPWTNEDGRRERYNRQTGEREVEKPYRSSRSGPIEGCAVWVVGIFALLFAIALGVDFVRWGARQIVDYEKAERHRAYRNTDAGQFENAALMSRQQGSPEPLRRYVRENPGGEHVDEAMRLIAEYGPDVVLPHEIPDAEVAQAPERYPSSYRRRFLEACRVQAENDYCRCAWEAVTHTVSVVEFEAIEAAGPSHPGAARISEAVSVCRPPNEALAPAN